MGTNFFLRHKATLEQKKRIKNFVDEDNFDNAIQVIKESTKIIHVGKRSYGWQFLFDLHRNKEWEDDEGGIEIEPNDFSLETVQKYINDNVTSGEWVLEDEYGEEFTPEQFWKEEVGESLYNDPEHYINGKQYDAKHPDERHYYLENTEYTTKDGLRYDTRWFA